MISPALIGKKIYFARLKIGFNQQALASYMNVSQQTVSRWETGKFYPEMEKLCMIAELTKKPIEWFFKDDGKFIDPLPGFDELRKNKLSNDKKEGVKRYPEIVHTDNSNAGTIDDNMASAIEGRILELKDTDNLILEALNRIADSLENVRGELSDVKKNMHKTAEHLEGFAQEQKKGEALARENAELLKNLVNIETGRKASGKTGNRLKT